MISISQKYRAKYIYLLVMLAIIWISWHFFSSHSVCSTIELARSESPDGKWIAKANEESCPSLSLMSAPMRFVVLLPKNSQLEPLYGEKILQFEIEGVDDQLAIRWLGNATLEITVSDAIKSFVLKRPSYGSLQINYRSVPSRPWPLNAGN